MKKCFKFLDSFFFYKIQYQAATLLESKKNNTFSYFQGKLATYIYCLVHMAHDTSLRFRLTSTFHFLKMWKWRNTKRCCQHLLETLINVFLSRELLESQKLTFTFFLSTDFLPNNVSKQINLLQILYMVTRRKTPLPCYLQCQNQPLFLWIYKFGKIRKRKTYFSLWKSF